SGGISSRQGLKDMTLSGRWSNDILGSNNIASGIISFATPTYYPTGEMPLKNNAVTLNGTLGGEIEGTHISVSAKGYYSKQELVSREQMQPGYGTLYLAEGQHNAYGTMDVNREKDVPYNKYMVALA